MLRYVVAALILFAILTVVYLASNAYLRWDLKRKLEARHTDGEGNALTREDFVQKGLAEYERSIEKKVLLGIFVLPFAIIAVLSLFVN